MTLNEFIKLKIKNGLCNTDYERGDISIKPDEKTRVYFNTNIINVNISNILFNIPALTEKNVEDLDLEFQEFIVNAINKAINEEIGKN